jgi:hypothetical protein
MPASLATDPDYLTSEALTPWRRQSPPLAGHARTSAKYRRHMVQLPDGVLYIELAGDADEPAWLLPALGALSELGALPENWNSYGARRIGIHAVAGVAKLLSLIMTDTTPLPAFVPTQAGGIQIEWHERGIDLEIEVAPTATYRAALEDSSAGVDWAGDVTSDLRPLRRALVTLAGSN